MQDDLFDNSKLASMPLGSCLPPPVTFNTPCPSCGYCPTCGRSRNNSFPYPPTPGTFRGVYC